MFSPVLCDQLEAVAQQVQDAVNDPPECTDVLDEATCNASPPACAQVLDPATCALIEGILAALQDNLNQLPGAGEAPLVVDEAGDTMTGTLEVQNADVLVGRNLGVGTLQPAARLHVVTGDGDVRATSNVVGHGPAVQFNSGLDGGQLEWRNGAARHWNIDQAGDELRFFTEANDDGAGVVRMSVSEPGQLRLPSLAGCNTIDTDASGALVCGIDEVGGGGGAGGGWVDDGSVVRLASAADDVGIGTSTPSGRLQVATGDGSVVVGANVIGHGPALRLLSGTDGGQLEWRNGAARHWNIDQAGDELRFFTEDAQDGAGVVRMSVTEPGDLTVSGHINAHNDQHVGDVAEPVRGAGLEAGDLVVLDGFDAAGKLQVRKADAARDPHVVGVVSTNPSLRLAGLPTDVPLAVTGIVPMKVAGPVAAGDLLTTSGVPGHAEACRDAAGCFGATIGKALEAHPGPGPGLVRALVALG